MALRENLQKILDNYNSARKDSFSTSHPICQYFQAFSQSLGNTTLLESSPTIKVKWSNGKGNWATVPWIVLLDHRVTTTTQEGVYCVFLFRDDMSGVYLTFNQGVTNLHKEVGTKESKKVLELKANIIRLKSKNLIGYDFYLDNDIDLKTTSHLGKRYEFSTIAHKLYETHNIPSDEIILNDIDQLLGSYSKYIENMNETLSGDNKTMNDQDGLSANSSEKSSALNLILYGPPGTGKTYSAIRRAVKICDGDLPDDKTEFAQRFKELLESDQISMVTFHQSYGYEEFVEGIRPVLIDGGDGGSGEAFGDGIQYECRDGIFKKLCLLAKDSPLSSAQSGNLDLAAANIWKMSLGNTLIPDQAFIYDDCIKNNYILLGYGEGLNFSECDNREEVRDKLRENNPDIKDNDYHITSVNIFKNKVKNGDLVIISDGNRKFRAIGKIIGDYQFCSESEYGQMRPVKWLAVFDESLPREKIIKKVFSQATIYQLHNKILKIDGLSDLLSPKINKVAKNYVLIVDEINRGNVSKVLGELITLLEPDKRLDAPNEIIVTLPYSGEQFGVPGNIYIVGTMNTSDRSIAFIDSALRRRFEFIEMLPDLGVIEKAIGGGGKINEVSILDLLKSLNQRIELIYDRDHQIGHSYFMKTKSLSDLREIFLSEIIPLLQEYFYSDWNKVCQILGCPYDLDTGEMLRENKFPMIQASMLTAMDSLGFELDEVENSLRYEINPEFVSADENILIEFFNGV
jgi:5-methylcytosine-specific restriction enzyme B